MPLLAPCGHAKGGDSMSGHNVILDVQNLQTYFPIQGGVVRKTVEDFSGEE